MVPGTQNCDQAPSVTLNTARTAESLPIARAIPTGQISVLLYFLGITHKDLLKLFQETDVSCLIGVHSMGPSIHADLKLSLYHSMASVIPR